MIHMRVGDNRQVGVRRNGHCLKCGTIIGRFVVFCSFRFEFRNITFYRNFKIVFGGAY